MQEATSPRLHIRLLGTLAVEHDGQEQVLPSSRKCRALLALLALDLRAHRREQLCELLWADTDDPRAGLRWALTKLRPVLGDALQADRDTVRLDGGTCTSDLHVLRAALAEPHAAGGDLPGMETALQGGYLPGLDGAGGAAFDQWLATERHRLQQSHLALLKQLQNGAPPEEALALARRRVAIDNLDIDACLDLCRLLLVGEGIAAARKQFEASREQLRQARLDDADLLAGWRRLSGAAARPAQPVSDDQETADAPTLPEKPSVAVLGFEDIGEPGVLSVGLTADLIGKLSRLGGLFVIARASSTQFRPDRTSFSEAGRKLGVRYLVHGSVQQHSGRIRLHVELVEAELGRQVWSESYDRARDDLFLLQDELADAVVSALEPAIERAEYERASLKPPESLDAWENFHMALWHSFRFTAEDTQRAHGYLQRALAQDPQFSRAHAAMSLVHFSRAFLDASDAPQRDIAAALACAEQSVGLDGRDAMGHWSLGRAQFLSQQHDLALDSIDRALQVNPNYAQGHYARGFVGFHAGEDEQTLLELDTARRLSPFDPLMFAMTSSRAMTLALGGQFEEAAKLAVSATQQPNAHFHIFAVAAACLELAGQRERAREQLAMALARHPGYSRQVFFRSFPHKLADRRNVLDGALQRAGLE